MYGIIKSVIENKNYDLNNILKKIQVIWVQGSISEAERDELFNLARINAEVNQSIDVLAKLEEIDQRIKVIEEALKNNSGEADPGDEEPGETTYPEFKVGNWYYAGDIVTFEGKTYKCIAPDKVVCVWSPVDYPAYWEEV